MNPEKASSETIERWLAAEAAARDDEAERLLGELFVALPEDRPSPWFAQRVMAALPLPSPLPAWNTWFTRRWARTAVAAGLVSAGISAALVPGLLALLFGGVRPSAVIGIGVGAFVAFCRWFVGALAFWDWLGGLADPLARTAANPSLALALALTSLVATLALVSLSELMARERSPHHAQSH